MTAKAIKTFIATADSAALKKAIKRAYKIFGYERSDAVEAHGGTRRQQQNFLLPVLEEDERLVQRFAKVLEREGLLVEEQPKIERAKRSTTRKAKRPAASARKTAPKRRARAPKQSRATRTTTIPGNTDKLVEYMGLREPRDGGNILMSRGALEVRKSRDGLRVVYDETKLGSVVRFLRKRLEGNAALKRISLEGSLTDRAIERLGLRARRDGSFNIVK